MSDGPTLVAVKLLLANTPPYEGGNLTVTLPTGQKAECKRIGHRAVRMVRISGVNGQFLNGWMLMSRAIAWARKQDEQVAA